MTASQPSGNTVDAGKIIFSEEEMRRAISRIAHEILERNAGARNLVLVGLHTRGIPLARRLAERINALEGIAVPVHELDITNYRDDRPAQQPMERAPLDLPVAGKTVVLVEAGRPRRVQLAVMVDRGHRELPIRADYVGKNVPTALSESIHVRLREIDGLDAVALVPAPERSGDEPESGGKSS